MKSLLLFIIYFLSLTLTKPDSDPLDAINLNINIPYEKPDGIQENKRKEMSGYQDMVFHYGNNGNNNGYIKRRFKALGYEKAKYTKYGRYGRYGRSGRHGKKATIPAPTTNPSATSPTRVSVFRKGGRRVFRGTETKVNKYRWIVLLYMPQGHNCGGSVIAAKWILTAAHCLDIILSKNLNPLDTIAVIGEHDTETPSETSITKRESVDKYIIHPQWDSFKRTSDIALLRLSKPVDLIVYTPVCLAKTGQDFADKKAWIYGWGYTEHGSTSTKLLDAEIPVVSDEFAKQALSFLKNATLELSDELLADVLFAGGEGGKDSCSGDSGGPLSLRNRNGKHTQIGIVSYGYLGCGKDGLPAIYTDVSVFRQWIDSQIGGAATNCG